MTLPACADRSERALRILNGSRYYQNFFYVPLLAFGLMCLVWEPSSPISRFMPWWLHGTYLAMQILAPSMSFVGQIIQQRYPENNEIVENGWKLQLGADIGVTSLMFVASYSFWLADDEPSALFILPIGVLLVGGAISLVVRDVIAVVRWNRERRHGVA